MESRIYMLYFKTRFGVHLSGVFNSLSDTEKHVLAEEPDRRKYYFVESIRAGHFYPGFSSADYIKEVRHYAAEGWFEGPNMEKFVSFDEKPLMKAESGGR